MNTAMKIMALGNNAWGQGTDVSTAIENWRKNARIHSVRGSVTVHMRAVALDGQVDGLGHLSASKIVPLPDVVFTEQDIEAIWGGEELLAERLEPVTDQLFDLELGHLV